MTPSMANLILLRQRVKPRRYQVLFSKTRTGEGESKSDKHKRVSYPDVCWAESNLFKEIPREKPELCKGARGGGGPSPGVEERE